MADENEIDDVEFEADDSPDSNTHEKLLAKVEKLKSDLKKSQAEKQEYLDGWQRMRADVANVKRDQSQAMAGIQSAVKEEVISDFIPILDSFDMAMQGEGWNSVNDSWRKGVEYIHAQCLAVLDKHGIASFGKAGELFDPQLHESAQEVEDASVSAHSIVRVLRHGYRMNGRLIRPAQVIVSLG
jgi:molecular chaperone GrpE